MPRLLRRTWVCALLAVFAPGPATNAQTLAHRNWVGNGLTTAPWWQNGIFYHLAIPAFQDSDGDGFGDLAGITQRLDYLQSLGVDAIILQPSTPDEHFDDLQRAANARHLRILIELSRSSADLLPTARNWLTRGAAGIVLEESGESNSATPQDLRKLVTSFPGSRILVEEPQGFVQPPPAGVFQLVRQPYQFPEGLRKEFFPTSVLDTKPPALPQATFPLVSAPGANALVQMDGADARGQGLQKISAARLLLRPGASYWWSSDELGMQEVDAGRSGPHRLTPMSWTPTNLTTTPKPEIPPPASTAPDPATYNASNYTGYRPYVAPKPKPKPVDPNTPSLPPDPATLPGFSTKPLTNLSPNIATANVATEDADPLSLLNFYRRLAQLHHDHPALRGGTLTDIDLSAQKAFAWVIKPPAGTRTARTIVVIANFSDRPQTLNLDATLIAIHLRHGGLRPLLASWTTTPSLQYTHSITLPPFGVYAGEF